jgi:hypothetical protein
MAQEAQVGSRQHGEIKKEDKVVCRQEDEA